MKLITTELTAQKLKESLQKGSLSPKFDYSNPEELEARYRVFSQEARTQLEPQNKPAVRCSRTSMKFEREEDIKALVKSSYKRFSDEKKQGKLNPIVKYCGNFLIASIFDALILKGIEEFYKGKGLFDGETAGITEKLLNIFGIDQFQLRCLKSFKEKRNYLIATMNQTIEKLLKNWREKIETRERNNGTLGDSIVKKEKEKDKDSLDNSFSFLKLKTKYEALRKKLTGTVVQKLNDYENQLKIVKTLHQRQKKRESLLPINHDELKVNFSNIEKPHLFPTSKFSTPNTSLLKYSNSGSSRHLLHKSSAQQFNAKFMAFNNFNYPGSAHSRNMSTILTSEILENSLKNPKEKNGLQSPRKKALSSHLNQYLEETSEKAIDINEKHFKDELIWDKKLEKDFQGAKVEGKTLFFNEVKKNNWDFLAIRNMVQKIFTEEKKNTQRIEKMKRYSEGDYLTGEELKFLADSSELLNACVDKKYLQNAVNIIDENNLHYIELNLAEKIIRKYEEMKKIITQARLNFFQEKNHHLIEKIQDFSAKKDKEKRQMVLSEKGKRYKKMIGTIWQLIDVKNQEQQEKDDDKIIDEMILKNFNAKFKKTFSIADLLRKKEAKIVKEKIIKDVIKKPNYQNLINELKNPIVIKHKFHPSSKLHKLDPDEQNTKGTQYLHYIDNVEQEYKILIKGPGTIRVPRNFARFYSGGPKVNQSEPLYEQMNGQIRRPTHREIKAIIHIQSRLRGLMARSRFKCLIENDRNQKFVETQERIVSKHKDKLQKQKEESDYSPSDKNSFSPSSYCNRKLQQNKTKQLRFSCKSVSEDQSPSSSRENRIRTRDPPKSLLLKHRKLIEAAINDNYFMVNNSGFLYYPNDINIKDKLGNTALFYTALNSNVEFSRFLLKTGANVNIPCSEGNTPLHMAFKSNKIEIIMLIMEYGGDLNKLNHKAQTPLAFCSKYTLEVLDLTKGIVTVNDRNKEEMEFDNNKLMYKLPNNNVKFEPTLGFNFEGLRRTTMKVKEKGKILEYSKKLDNDGGQTREASSRSMENKL